MEQSAFGPLTKQNIVVFLGDIFERRGDEEYLGEPVTMAEHMLQSAHFAEQANEPDIVVVAALLHDIGHFTSEFGMFSMDDTEDRYHETAGADILRAFFPELVVDCVRHHVAAKRYLCATSPSYVEELTEASRQRLGEQGGPMNQDEVRAFELQPYYWEAVKLRSFDEMARVKGMRTPELERFRPYLMACMRPAR